MDFNNWKYEREITDILNFDSFFSNRIHNFKLLLLIIRKHS